MSQKGIQQGYRNCPIKTINARHLDGLVRALVLGHLSDESFDPLRRSEAQTRDHWVRAMIHRVCLAPDQLAVELDTNQIEACREHEWSKAQDGQPPEPLPTCLYEPQVQKRRHRVTLTLPIQIKRLDGRRMLLSPDGQDLFMPAEPEPKDHLVRAIGQAYAWRQRLLGEGIGVKQLAESINITKARIHKLLPLTLLGPEILKRALTGDLPPRVTLNDLLDAAAHLDWSRQSAYLGLVEVQVTKRVEATA